MRTCNCNVVFVILTTFLITFIPLSSQFFVIIPWFIATATISHFSSIFTLAIFNFCVLMIWINYWKACRTDPGGVPKNWEPPNNPTENSVIELKKSSNQPRFCRTCNVYKPPRSHHCSQCERCVLKMDHHCPWVNNCVGYYNQGYFIRFLFYVDISCLICITLLASRLSQVWGDSYYTWYYVRESLVELTMIVLNLVLAVPVLLSVGGLSIYHFYYLFTNTTTIESMEKDKAAKLAQRGRISQLKYPYHLGYVHNISSVLGPKPHLWLLPVPMPPGGMFFPVKNKGEDVNPLLDDSTDSCEPYMESPPYSNAYSSGAEYSASRTHHFRRGSEGLEVRMISPIERSEILQQSQEYHNQMIMEGKNQRQFGVFGEDNGEVGYYERNGDEEDYDGNDSDWTIEYVDEEEVSEREKEVIREQFGVNISGSSNLGGEGGEQIPSEEEYRNYYKSLGEAQLKRKARKGIDRSGVHVQGGASVDGGTKVK